MLFKKHMPAPECDQSPCGTGMSYLKPSYDRTVSTPRFIPMVVHAQPVVLEKVYLMG